MSVALLPPHPHFPRASAAPGQGGYYTGHSGQPLMYDGKPHRTHKFSRISYKLSLRLLKYLDKTLKSLETLRNNPGLTLLQQGCNKVARLSCSKSPGQLEGTSIQASRWVVGSIKRTPDVAEAGPRDIFITFYTLLKKAH